MRERMREDEREGEKEREREYQHTALLRMRWGAGKMGGRARYERIFAGRVCVCVCARARARVVFACARRRAS